MRLIGKEYLLNKGTGIKSIPVFYIQKDTTFNYSLSKTRKKLKDGNYTGALKEALVIYDKSLKLKDNKHKYLSSKLIADIYIKTKKYKEAIIFYKKSLKLLSTNQALLDKTLNNNAHLLYKAEIEVGIGSAYLRLYRDFKDSYYTKDFLLSESKKLDKDNKKSILNKSKSLRDSSIHYFQNLTKLSNLNNGIERYIGSAYINLSGIYELDSLYQKAQISASKAIEIYQRIDDKLRIAKSQNNLANVFLSTGNFNKAKTLYSNAIASIDKIKDQEATEFKSLLYYNLAWAMRNLKEVEAYDNLEKSYEIEDLLKEKDVREIIKKIESNHKENLEKQKVDLVKNQIELEKHQKRTTNYLLGALSLLILTISGVVIYNYTLRQRNLHLKIEQNKLVEQQKIAQIKSDSQKMILNAAIDGKETERKQIAETLHDSVSALLSSANMHLLATKRQFNGNTPVELDKTQKIILEASQKVRDLSHNLVSSILLKFGLEYSLQDITQKYSNSELTFHPDMNNIPRYDQDFEIKMYNVIHELINNIIKHSKAANAYIVLEDTGDFLSVLIEDDGVGFNYRNSKVKSGLGLNQIEARIQMMNGNIIIESAENRGTKITMSVPTIKKKEVNLV